MTTAEFVTYLSKLDIQLAIDGERLRCSAPEGVLTDAMRSEIAARKSEIVTWLSAKACDPDTATREPYSDGVPEAAPLAPLRVPGRPAPRAAAVAHDVIPVSFAQQRLWFLDKLEPGSAAYTIAGRRRFHGPLDLDALTQALTQLVRRHESLRTTFPSKDGEPVQRISEPEPLALEVIDLESESSAERSAVAWRVREQTLRPFDLAHGPLFRAVLIVLGPAYHELLMVVHHIAADGWSLGILARELTVLYEAYLTGRPSPLADPPIQYADFALWQRRWLSGEVLDAQLRYWKEQLANLPPMLRLPTDYQRSGRPTSAGASHDFALPRTLADGLRTLSRHEGVTLFMLLLAAFKVLISRYSGQQDIAVGTPVANRDHVELEPVVGFFANTLVLRTDLAGDPPFRELLRRVRETCLGAYAHPDMPFERLVEELQPERTLGQNPLFQVSFVLQDASLAADFSFVTVASPFDVTLFISTGADGTLGATVQYKRDLFEVETIKRMADHYCMLLRSVVTDPDRRLSSLPLMSEDETRQLLADWNSTTVPYPRDRAVPGLFEDAVDAAPDAPALVFEEMELSYRELDRRANQLAHCLRELGVARERPVGVLMGRSADLIVAFLGILKAGGAYVPLDPLSPRDRLALIIDNTKIDVVLTHDGMRDRLPAPRERAIFLDVDRELLGGQSATRLEGSVGGDAVAYVMYTSGSTGEPKGVAVTHRGVVRLVKGTDYASFGRDEVMLQLAAPWFDASTFEIWGALLNGGRLIIAPPPVLSVDELWAVLARHGVTTLWLTAGLFEQVVDHRLESLEPLRQLLAGGDVLSPPHVRRALAAFPELRLINGYGPTEGTTFTCCHTVKSALPPGRSVPIGRPVANTRVYVLDDQRQPVPIGVPGELWIAGDGLARGYINQPELTAERFVVHRFSPTLEERLYRTGDLVRWRGDATLEFIGRLDEQVKVRGFRVEPGEIESALARHPRIRTSAVSARPGADGDKRLVAYVVSDGVVDGTELRQFLRRILPEYMVPAMFVSLDGLPLNANGKVDRRALPDTTGKPDVQAPIEPRDELERQLVQIWQDILPVRSVGVGDSFFDLGGHSLLAVKMVARIDATLGVVLPLATLFEAPTIEGLARMIRQHIQPASGRLLVGIQPGGRQPPLFAMPGVGGSVLNYHALACLLGPDQPFYGLQSRGLDGKGRPLTRIEDIAAECLREIREIQPDGPYRLIGLCMGGIVAYEMAQQLRSAGQQVELLALVDSWPSQGAPLRVTYRGVPSSIAFLADRLRLYAQTLSQLRGRERLGYLLERLKRLKDIIIRRDPYRGIRTELFVHAVTRANLLAYERYKPRPYAAPVVLFCAEQRHAAVMAKLRRAWRELAVGGLDIHTLPCTDSGLMLTEPHVRALAAQLDTCIEQLQGSKLAPGCV